MSRAQSSAQDSIKIFVSYSRDDRHFADQLVQALENFGHAPQIDRKAIEPGEDWQARLSGLMVSADVVVFVLSESSAASKVCRWEVEEAGRLGKRLIPVLCGPMSNKDVPDDLSKLNFIFFYPDDKAAPDAGFWTGLIHLDSALKTDLSWTRDQTRLGELASHWHAKGRPADLLIRGSELQHYQDWYKRKPADAPPIPGLLRDFLQASDEAEQARNDERRRQLEERERNARRLRTVTLYGLVAVTLLLVTSVTAGWGAARFWVNGSKQLSNLIAEYANGFYAEKEFEKALYAALLADPATQRNFLQQSDNKNAREEMIRAFYATLPPDKILQPPPFQPGLRRKLGYWNFTPDGKHVLACLTYLDGNRAISARYMVLWDVETADLINTVEAPCDAEPVFSANGRRVAMTGGSRYMLDVLDVMTGRSIQSIAIPAPYYETDEVPEKLIRLDATGEKAIFAVDDGQAGIVDVATGEIEPLASLEGQFASDAYFVDRIPYVLSEPVDGTMFGYEPEVLTGELVIHDLRQGTSETIFDRSPSYVRLENNFYYLSDSGQSLLLRQYSNGSLSAPELLFDLPEAVDMLLSYDPETSVATYSQPIDDFTANGTLLSRITRRPLNKTNASPVFSRIISRYAVGDIVSENRISTLRQQIITGNQLVDYSSGKVLTDLHYSNLRSLDGLLLDPQELQAVQFSPDGEMIISNPPLTAELAIWTDRFDLWEEQNTQAIVHEICTRSGIAERSEQTLSDLGRYPIMQTVSLPCRRIPINDKTSSSVEQKEAEPLPAPRPPQRALPMPGE